MEREGGVYIKTSHIRWSKHYCFAPLYAASERALVIPGSWRSGSAIPLYGPTTDSAGEAGVVRVVFATQLEQSMQRERR
ncbi:MAG: hypothetical protein CM1200mP14_13500 [Gammaproteobacteria bacterium]|nr:MAG: hypothetical protein CM1200mP14_13500 [Gammaproteobacteria bacterium]